MKKSILSAVLSIILCIAVVTGTMSFAFAKTDDSDTKELKIAVMSDDHYLSPTLIKDTEDYETDLNSDRKMFTESDAILEIMLDAVREDKPDVLLISGDLTKDGELEDHEALAEKLAELKKDVPGLKVYVVPGNHDINNSNAKNFNTEDGTAVAATRTTPEAFLEAYEEAVYSDDSIIAQYTPPEGKTAGMLSYVARPAEGFTIICIDSARYSSDNTDSGEDEHETSGQISEDLEEWIVEQIKAANERGDVVIGMQHHGLAEHFTMEDTVLSMYLVNNYETLAEEFADAGMSYIFTGHMHANDVAELTTEAGNTILDIETGSLLTYPSAMRFVTISQETDNGTTTQTITSESYRDVGPITYTNPLTGETETIDNLTEYAREHGFSATMLTTTITGFIDDYISDDVSQNVIDEFISDLVSRLSEISVGSGKTLLDYVNWVYQSHLGGEDDGSYPLWVKIANAKLSNGTILNAVIDEALVPALAALPSEAESEILSSIPVIGQLFGISTSSSMTTQFLNYALRYGADTAQTAFPGVFTLINNFLVELVDSMSNDTNFTQDNDFTVSQTV